MPITLKIKHLHKCEAYLMQGAIFSLKRLSISGICELITPITLKNWPLGALLGCELGMPEGHT